MPKHPTELTESEWTIIKAVWGPQPCAAPAIQEKLHPHRLDLFHRAHAYGPHGRQGSADGGKGPRIYRSTVPARLTREQAQRGELFDALKHAFNGAQSNG